MTTTLTAREGGVVLDLFAGPGGWSEGLRSIGLHDIGLEWDDAACRTRAAAGHKTIRADVAAYPVGPFVGKVRGLIASPPCQEFSTAGPKGGLESDRGQLVWQVIRWADALRPEWIACEQVPGALPIWRRFADILRGWGYSAVAVVLNAADYGVPQTRRRAFLLASRYGVRVPEPTHAERPEPTLFGPARAPWRSMADALGWEGVLDRRNVHAGPSGEKVPVPVVDTCRPAPTVTGQACAGQWVVRTRGSQRTVTLEEGAVLQGFPADYPWQGTTAEKAQQLGNAVPPPLAVAIVGALADTHARKDKAA